MFLKPNIADRCTPSGGAQWQGQDLPCSPLFSAAITASTPTSGIATEMDDVM